MFQHTAARRRLVLLRPFTQLFTVVSTHSRPKAAGAKAIINPYLRTLFQHTAARRRLGSCFALAKTHLLFQHTAARRRLASRLRNQLNKEHVSTHSRPKAAGNPCIQTA